MPEMMLFHIGPYLIGLDLADVRNVYRVGDEAVSSCGTDGNGVCRVGDREMPVYDVSALLDVPPAGPNPAYRKVVALSVHDRRLALRVDQVDRVIDVDEQQIVPTPPVFRGKSLVWFPRILHHDGALVPILDPAGMAGIAPPPEPGPLDEWLSGVLREETVAAAAQRAVRRVLPDALNRSFQRLQEELFRPKPEER